MAINQTFAPRNGAGQTITTGTAAAGTIGEGDKVLCITNLSSTVIAYVAPTNDAAYVATAADYPIPASAQVTISKPQDYKYLAHYSASAGSIHVIPGEGK